MRPGGGRSKGNAFEREVAHDIVHAFRKFGITKADCYRTPLSGGHRQAREMDPGDLVISEKLAKLFPRVVECKRDRRFELAHLFVLPSKRAQSWVEDQFIQQAVQQALHQVGKSPLLVVRRNNEPALAIFPRSVPRSFGVLGYASSYLGFKSAVRWESDVSWFVARWDEFLSECVKNARSKSVSV